MPIARAKVVLPNAFLFFIEKGTTSENGGSTITVGPAAKPDNTPTSNWPDRPATLEFDMERETVVDSILVPRLSGGWNKEFENTLVGAKMMFTEKAWSENFERLAYCLPVAVAAATAQIPFRADPQIEGWLKIQQRNRSGADLIYCDVYGILTLKGGTKVDGKWTRPQYEFAIRDNDLNSWIAPS
jgi:hypothetical protein